MKVLARVLKAIGGALSAFAGYFIVAAEGWGEPLESMTLERGVIGGLVAVLGLALIWRAIRPRPSQSAPRSAAALEPAAPTAPITQAPEPEPESELEPAPAPLEAAHPAPEPEAPEPEAMEPEAMELESLEPYVWQLASSVEPMAHAPEPEPEPVHAPAPASIAAFLVQGDRLVAAGRLDEALDPYSEALYLARARHEDAPDNADDARALAGALKSNADVYDDQGRLDTAINLYEEALKLNRSLAASGLPGDRRALSLALERLADCREARGHRSRAADLYRESLAIAESLAQEDSANPLYAEDLAVTRRRLEELDGAEASA